MPVVVPGIKKQCAALDCKKWKDYNDDFGSDAGKPDFKDPYCKECRRAQLGRSRARGKCKNKFVPGKLNAYFKERKLRLYGERKPISDTEMKELIVYLSHPEAWEGISKERTADIKCNLRKILHVIKYESLWFPNGKLRVKLTLCQKPLRFR